MRYLLSILSLYLTTPVAPIAPAKTSLRVDVHNILSAKGSIFVALFRPGKEFPEGKPLEGKIVPANGKSAQVMFTVDPGEYAVAVYHDENSNGKMDKRLFGIPKEPYGFSNNFRSKISAPKFNDCKFILGDNDKQISITLDSF